MNGQRGKQGTQSRQQAQNPSHLLHLVAARGVKWGGGGEEAERNKEILRGFLSAQ